MPAAAPIAGGQVSLVALDTVWIRVSDANGQRLFEKELAKGERYDVPTDANRPSVRTGGPEKLQVLLNGSIVAPLGPAGQAVTAEISAAALQARNAPTGTPPAAQPTAPSPAASPVSAPAPSPSPTRAARPSPTPTPSPRPTTRPTIAPTPAAAATSNASTAP